MISKDSTSMTPQKRNTKTIFQQQKNNSQANSPIARSSILKINSSNLLSGEKLRNNSILTNKQKLNNKDKRGINKENKNDDNLLVSKLKEKGNSIEVLFEYEITSCEEDIPEEIDNFILNGKSEQTLTFQELQHSLKIARQESLHLKEENEELHNILNIFKDPSDVAQEEIQELQKVKDNNIIEINELKLRNQELENNLLEQINQAKSLSNTILSLQEAEKEKQIIIDINKNEISALVATLGEKEDTIRKMSQEFDNTKLILENDSLKEQNKQLESNLETTTKHNCDLEESLQCAKEQIQALTGKRESLNEEIHSLLNDKSELYGQINELENEKEKNQNLIQALETRNHDLNKKVMKNEEEIKDHVTKIDVMQGMLKKMGEDRKVQVVINEKCKIAELEDMLNDKNNKLRSLTTDFNQLTNDLNTMRTHLKERENDLTNQTKIMVSFSSRLTEKETELIKALENITLIENKLENEKRKSNSLQKILDDKNEQIKQLHAEKGKEIVQMQQKINKLTSEKESVYSKINNCSEDIKEYKDKLDKLTKERDEISKKKDEFEKKLEENEKTAKRQDNEIKSLQVQLKESFQTVSQMNSSIVNLEHQIKTQSQKHSQLNCSFEEKISENEQLRKENNEKKSSLRENEKLLEELQLKFDSISKELKEQVTQKEINEAKISGQESIITQQKCEIASLHQNICVIECKVSHLEEEKSLLTNKIDDMNKELSIHQKEYDNLQEKVNNSPFKDVSISNVCLQSDRSTNYISGDNIENSDENDCSISSLKQAIHIKTTQLSEMNIIVNNLTQLVQLLELQISEANPDNSYDFEKEHLRTVNKDLQKQVDTLKSDKEQLYTELISAQSVTRQLCSVLLQE